MRRLPVFSAGVAAIFAIALLHLRYPFWGDQALYSVGAQELARGARLYRDFWDLKQPGIYYFFLLAGRTFGWGEFGVHLLEALYQTLFAVVLIVAGANAFRERTLGAALPLLTIGVYYALADPPTLTSVEALAGFPLFICAWLTANAIAEPAGGAGKAAGAGFMAAIVVSFKLAFLPIVLAMWLAAALVFLRENRRGPAFRFALFATVGTLVPLALLGAYYASLGTLDAALQTWFVDPGRITRILPPLNLKYQLATFAHFLRIVAPVLALAALGVWSRRRSLDRLGLLMLAWFAAGMVVATAQVWSWNYRFFIVLVPLGFLAVYGLDALIDFANARRSTALRAAAAAALIALFVPLAGSFVKTSLAALPRRPPLIGALQSKWSSQLFAGYLLVDRDIALLDRPDSPAGDIYVLGDPRYYYRSGRGQAVPINGWSPQLLLPDQWRDLASQLDGRRPPYIFVAADRVALLARAPAIVSLLHASYTNVRHARSGDWYERRAPVSVLSPQPPRSAQTRTAP